jgi:hypothetical protein
MSESPSEITFSKSELEIRELIRHIKRRKWRFLFLILLFGAFTFYNLKFKVLDYSSTASFIVNSNNIISSPTLEFKSGENFSTNDNFNRIYELVNSAATQIHLIEKFYLFKHYNIDSTKEFSLQKAVATIRSHIIVKKSPYNVISVTVRDRYRYLTADMANEIVSYLEKLNENYYRNNIQKKILISQAYIEQLQRDNNQKSQTIDSIIQKINFILSNNMSSRSSFDFLMQQQKLNQIINTFQTSVSDIINSQKLYNLSLQTMNFKTFPTITVIQSAMPAHRSTAFTALLLSLGVMIVLSIVLFIQAYYYLKYRNYLRLFFSSK